MKGKRNKEKIRTHYISGYNLNFLNDKFIKKIKFNNFNQFVDCLTDNINQKKLIIKPPYKNVIKTIWKIFPKDSSKKETFTLVSSKNVNNKLSLFFYSNYEKAKDVVKVINNNLKLKESKQTENYKEFIYEKGLYLDNMVFLKYNEEKEEKIIKKKIYFLI